MNRDNVVYLTEEGLQKIKEELEFLVTDRREEISERLEVAISHGDLSENADYDYAKSEQAFVEGRIKDLEDSLRRAKIIDNGGQTDMVRVGSIEDSLGDSLINYPGHQGTRQLCPAGIHFMPHHNVAVSVDRSQQCNNQFPVGGLSAG